MPVVNFADHVTKATYGSCANSTDNGLVNVREIFDGVGLRVMEPFVEKGACSAGLEESALWQQPAHSSLLLSMPISQTRL